MGLGSTRIHSAAAKPAERALESAAHVRLLEPAAPAKGALDQIAGSAEQMLVDFIRERQSVKGSGQDNGGSGNVEVNERRAAISVLMSRRSRAELARILPNRGGKLLSIIRDDIAWLDKAERQPIRSEAALRTFDFSWAKNGTSTARVLKELAERRAELAHQAADVLGRDANAAYDASNDCLLAHLATDNPELRSQILADTILQFRAKRRSTQLIDRRSGAGETERDNTEGRLASSGPLATLEQRLACQELPPGGSAAARREYALARLAISSHPLGSTNGIFWARNSVAVLAAERFLGRDAGSKPVGQGPGLEVSLYSAIHKNYSANTPKVVDHFLRNRVFTAGDAESRVAILSACVEAMAKSDLDSARARLSRLEETHGCTIPGAAAAKTVEKLRAAVLAHLRAHSDVPSLKRLKQDDAVFAYQTLVDLHAAVSTARPSDATLEKHLFYAGTAWPEVAAVIHAVRSGDHPAALESLGRARTALAKAFSGAKTGFDRQMLLRLDRQVELLSAEVLGVSVSRIERAGADQPEQLAECLIAVQSALRGAIASGLDAIRSGRRTSPAPELGDVLKKVDAVLAKKEASVDELRSVMVQVFLSASEVAETMRAYFRKRELAIHFSKIDVALDPEFSDNLVKETSLHYLLALAQAGMTFGLESKVSDNEIRFVSGMRVLSSVGPTVYKRVLFAKDLEQLLRLGPTSDDFCIVNRLDEKKMVAVGGLLADTKDAPGGYSHLSVFAKGHGISAFALPELSKNYEKFFENIRKGGGLYVDDRQGSFVMKPLARAIEEGLVDEKRIDAMRPGFNQLIRYLGFEDGKERIVQAHDVHLSDERSTRKIELYVPELENRHGLAGVQTFEQMSALPFPRTRHLAGEKGAVLARLATSPALKALGVEVPGGASVAPFEIAGLMRRAGNLWDRWMSVWMRDPSVGEITPQNFLASKFYTDRKYRLAKAKEMREAVEKQLSQLLIANGKPTAEGEALLAKLEASPALRDGKAWIARSSFTGEDRPNKSGAGQYESYPNLRTKAERLQGIIGVITSAWGDTPIENNVQMQIDLRHIWPSVLVEACISPDKSGVAISRGAKGELGEVSYQAVIGFGGGVAKGKPEEGTVRADGSGELRLLAGKKASLLSERERVLLRDAMLAIEREFHDVIEPGQGYAVDVEWAFQGGTLHIVQARVITGE